MRERTASIARCAKRWPALLSPGAGISGGLAANPVATTQLSGRYLAKASRYLCDVLGAVPLNSGSA